MMTIPEKHFNKTKILLKAIDQNEIADWLLNVGYFPEQYVLPPCFHVTSFPLGCEKYKLECNNNDKVYYNIPQKELIKISYPKSTYSMRSFGIIDQYIYHDIVYNIINDWKTICKTLVGYKRKIYTYSIPIPLDSFNKGYIGKKRSGRMIYEFLDMAESDLVSEAYNFKYIIKTDITNFYPTVYTHSISWALHGKEKARKDKSYSLLGNKIDKLFQYANDRCTNGIAVGPAVCDLIAEILLCSVDRKISTSLRSMNFVGVRFKDDYRFLCKDNDDAHKILASIQKSLMEYNLSLNESKTDIKPLPEGLYREWSIRYKDYSLKYETTINYSRFEKTILAVLQIDKECPGTGVIDKFLNELHTNDYRLKCSFSTEEAEKAFSLLMLLKQRRTKAFPEILGTIEGIIQENNDSAFIEFSKNALLTMYNDYIKHEEDNEYELIWLLYFIKSIYGLEMKNEKYTSKLLRSIQQNRNLFFVGTEYKLFSKIPAKASNSHLWKHLNPFEISN